MRSWVKKLSERMRAWETPGTGTAYFVGEKRPELFVPALPRSNRDQTDGAE